jgi:hypothetical protein
MARLESYERIVMVLVSLQLGMVLEEHQPFLGEAPLRHTSDRWVRLEGAPVTGAQIICLCV